MKETIEFSPVIKSLELLSFNLSPNPHKSPTEIEFGLNYKSETKVNEEKKLIIIINHVHIISKKDKLSLCAVTTSVSFELSNFSQIARKLEDGKYFVEEEIDKELTVTSINTLRGMLFGLLKGTYLQNLILPYLHTNKLKRRTAK
jgi:hypothetical protein